jgi:hypothetical protein
LQLLHAPGDEHCGELQDYFCAFLIGANSEQIRGQFEDNQIGALSANPQTRAQFPSAGFPF